MFAVLRHARYILGENGVTAFAFALFLVIVVAALIGPTSSLRSARERYRGGAVATVPCPLGWHGSAWTRRVQPRGGCHTARFLHCAGFGRDGVCDGGLAGVAAGFFGGWTDRVVGRIADTSWPSRCSCLPWHGCRPWQHRTEHRVCATRSSTFRFSAHRSHRGQCAPRYRVCARGAALGNGEIASCSPSASEHHADHGGADVAHHGLRHSHAAGLSFHRARRAAAYRGMGVWWRKARRSWSPANGGSPSFRRCADDRGILL